MKQANLQLKRKSLQSLELNDFFLKTKQSEHREPQLRHSYDRNIKKNPKNQHFSIAHPFTDDRSPLFHMC